MIASPFELAFISGTSEQKGKNEDSLIDSLRDLPVRRLVGGRICSTVGVCWGLMAIETSADGATTIGPAIATEAQVAARAIRVIRTIILLFVSAGGVLG